MITSKQIQNLSVADFSFLYSQCVINQETEKILGKVFEEQYLMKYRILRYNLNNISELYHVPILEKLKTRLLVSSIYIQNKYLYIDWSL